MNFGYIPHWDAKRQSLYVTNATVSLIRYDAVSKRLYEGVFTDTTFKVDFFVSYIYSFIYFSASFPLFIIIYFQLPTTQGENRFVAAYGRNVYLLEWDGFDSNVEIVEKIATLPGTEGLTYVNTAKTDPKNRLLIATWRYDRCNPKGNSPDGSVFLVEGEKAEAIIDAARYPSGLEWNTTLSKMYYIDICKLNIMAFDWSEKDGTISNPSIAYDFRKDFPIASDLSHYLPVNSNINNKGNLMVALFNESKVVEINPT